MKRGNFMKSFDPLKDTAKFLQFDVSENDDFIEILGNGSTEGFQLCIDKNTGEHFYLEGLTITRETAPKYQLLLHDVFHYLYVQERLPR